jgi:hypothetical protein
MTCEPAALGPSSERRFECLGAGSRSNSFAQYVAETALAGSFHEDTEPVFSSAAQRACSGRRRQHGHHVWLSTSRRPVAAR